MKAATSTQLWVRQTLVVQLLLQSPPPPPPPDEEEALRVETVTPKATASTNIPNTARPNPMPMDESKTRPQ